jgi:diguanylate cyclase (GGDEF)-like protein
MESVVTLKTLDSSIISLIILIFILINLYNRSDRLFPDRELFLKIVIFNIFIIIVDLLSWAFNGVEGTAFMALNAAFNCIGYMAAPVAPMLWMLYVDYQIYHDEKRLKRVKRVLFALLAVNAALSAASLFTGWFFGVDSHNIYYRGPLFLVYNVFNYLLMAYTAILLLIKKRALQGRYFYSMLLFFVPPVTGMLLQTFIYGVSYNWVGMALSVLIYYLNIQNKSLSTDYLTGAYNRRRLEEYKKSRQKNGGGEAPFSAIMFDLDNLKQINDELGHDAGDEALKDAVDIIRRSIRESDFVSRIGGDEFIVILDIKSPDILRDAKKRIERSIAAFNEAGKKPYTLSLSYGYRVYNAKSGEKMEDFFKNIDSLMYRDKNKKREKQDNKELS